MGKVRRGERRASNRAKERAHRIGVRFGRGRRASRLLCLSLGLGDDRQSTSRSGDIGLAIFITSVRGSEGLKFLALYFSLFSLMIFRLLCLLPSAALFTLTIWPFGPLPPRSPLRWRPHKELCFDWSVGLSTGVFLSIRANVRPPSSQWIPTKLTSSPTSSYSAPASVLIPLQLFLGSPSTALFPLLNMYLR